MKKIGLNGFGRIGRAITRINNGEQFEIVAINDINPDINNMEYLLKYDSVYGGYPGVRVLDDQHIVIAGQVIRVYREHIIHKVPWELHDVDIVIDACGVMDPDYKWVLSRNVDRIVFTHIDNPEAKTIIFGVNEDSLEDTDRILSASICDSIALAPIYKLLSERAPIKSGFLTTLHPWLAYQNLLDGPSKSWSHPGDVHSHYALGRASVQNIIPKSTSATMGAAKVIPEIVDKISAFSYRVPTQSVCGANLTLELEDDSITRREAIKLFYDFEDKQTRNIINNTVEPLTSIDYKGNDASVIIDHRWTESINDTSLRLVYWYDNEWGYSSRVVDLVKML